MASTQSTSLSRESFLEKKIQILDKRLTLVEKFIDLRFRGGGGRDKDRYSGGSDCDDNSFDVSRSATRKSGKGGGSSKQSRSHICKGGDSSSSSSEDSAEESSKTSQKIPEVTKKLKPGPASAKRRKLNEIASKSKGLKECVVNVTRTEFAKPVASSTPLTSASGRPRRTPKRFQEENFESQGQGTRTRASARKKERDEEECDDGDRVVKMEVSDNLPAATYEIELEDYVGDGPASPMDNDYDEEADEEAGYFTFPSSQSRRSVTSGTGRNDNDSHSIDGDNNDVNWDVDGDEDDEDDEMDETPEKKPKSQPVRKTGSPKGSPRKKRGSYKKVKVEGTPGRRNRRKYVKVDLTDLPSDAITNSDPTQKLCHLCNWHFKVEVFEAHLESHTKERHLKCPECGKSYFNQFILKKHMRVHQPEKYAKKCRQCGKPFLHSDKLLAHERYCVKKALEKNEHVDPEFIEDLKKRSKTDTSWIEEAIEVGSKVAEDEAGVKKQCPHCQKNFKSSIYERHLKTHTRAKNWSCNMCDKAYHYKHDLVRHVAMEHINDPVCEFCQKTFPDRGEFKSHLTGCRKKHRKESGVLKITEVTSLVEVDEGEITTGNVKVERQSQGDEVTTNEEEEEEGNVETVSGTVQEVLLFDEDATQKVTLGLVGGGEISVEPDSDTG